MAKIVNTMAPIAAALARRQPYEVKGLPKQAKMTKPPKAPTAKFPKEK